jgi:hypothetical protein
MDKDETTGEYKTSKTVALSSTATAETGYAFDYWTADNDLSLTNAGNSVLNQSNVTVAANTTYTITAYFDTDEIGGTKPVDPANPDTPVNPDNIPDNVIYPDNIPDKYQVVVQYVAGSNGSVSGETYQTIDLRQEDPSDLKTSVTLTFPTATPNSGYAFSRWTADAGTLTNGILSGITAGNTYTITANFTRRTTGGGDSGTSSGNGGPTITTGGDVTEIVDPDVPLAGDADLNDVDHFAYISGYEDGTVRPTNNITREEVAAIFYKLLTDTSRAIYETDENDFSDVSADRWSNRAISTLTNAGILSGYPDGTFRPQATITRAEFATVAAQFEVVTENLVSPFTDTDGHWAENFIAFAASKNWVSGYEDGTFRPQQNITRAEVMTMVNNVLHRAVDKEGLLPDAKQWPDNQEGKWYYYQVLEATNGHDYERRVAGEVMENWTALWDNDAQ